MSNDDKPVHGPWKAPWEDFPPSGPLPNGRARKAAGQAQRAAWARRNAALRATKPDLPPEARRSIDDADEGPAEDGIQT